MEGNGKNYHAERNFILQQGLSAPPAESCPLRLSALMFQPRIVGTVVLAAVLLQSPAIFLALSGVLWWSALFPRWNPFDALYNRTFGARPAALRLSAAPAPRRFSQGMAGSFALAIGGSLLFGWTLGFYPGGIDAGSARRTRFRPLLPGIVHLPSRSRSGGVCEEHPSVATGTLTQ
ncbi:MAG: DUF4395 family protein [Candidatus Deferrimicrobiaceae bacterium]